MKKIEGIIRFSDRWQGGYFFEAGYKEDDKVRSTRQAISPLLFKMNNKKIRIEVIEEED